MVGSAKPFLQIGIDLGGRGEFDAVGDAIFFGEAAGVDEAFGEFTLVSGEAETEIDAGIGGGLDLGEDVIAVERNHGFAGAGFDVGAERFSELKKFFVHGAQGSFFPGILILDILRGGGEISFGRVFFPALSVRRDRRSTRRNWCRVCVWT